MGLDWIGLDRIRNKDKDIGMVIWAGILRMRKGWVERVEVESGGNE